MKKNGKQIALDLLVARQKSAERITLWCVSAHGDIKNAAEALGVDYTTLWRAARGTTMRGPSSALIETLIEKAGKTFNYWRGR